ncbi:telomerase reverse transcriptase LALA0_S04e00364g [Lachancea lanzarotensis]|uniref:Telomerase reverse transcriptase n=1 Tax=Lachancea lanzarotensis TaxID=1245769 RepID=A0A0C7MW14_9SACH|nr:uncharacterized protein LALA0_S04e00364g [Lachancea lanzarotensis]CEP61775.1 LALA0S04e00364g1_1 [Lachancea lanzarotensis]
MKSLEDYITQDLLSSFCDNEDAIENIRFRLTGTDDQLKHALSNVFVARNSVVSSGPSVISTEHASVVDECIRFLVTNRSNNVLAYGYKVAKNADVLSTVHCESTNFSVALLKCGIWRTLHKIIGTRPFVDLIVNSVIYEFKDGHFRQIAGPTHEHPARFGQTFHSTVGSSSYLYRNKGQRKVADILPTTVHLFWLQIFYGTEHSGEVRRLLEPRCPYLRIILHQIIRNHQRLNYRIVFRAFCRHKNVEACATHQELQTSANTVIRFLTAILVKLFPLEFFGSKHNKSVVMSKVSALVKLNVHGRIPVDLLVEGIKIKDLRWLGKRARIDSTEATRRGIILKVVYGWLFGEFLPSLITSFFYCTELSATQDILFFDFDVWSRMTQPFLTSYLAKYLTINERCSNHKINGEFTHGFLRLTPKTKKDDFRVIFVPLKLKSTDQLKTQLDQTQNTTRLMGNVLHYVLAKTESQHKTTFSNRLYSPLRVLPAIDKFKRYLMAKYQEFPPIYFVKFDIRSCYDSIPRTKAESIIKTIIDCFPDFYVRLYSFFDSKRNIFKQRYSVNGEVASESKSVFIDNVRTTFLSKDDVLNTLHDQMFNCSITYKGVCYLRKAGLFQGAGFSAHVVDFLYNDMVDKEEVFRDNNDEKLLLRLADDFLAISTSRTYIAKLEKQVRQGFSRYNAFANADKVISNLACYTTKVRFCAIDVDLGVSEPQNMRFDQ